MKTWWLICLTSLACAGCNRTPPAAGNAQTPPSIEPLISELPGLDRENSAWLATEGRMPALEPVSPTKMNGWAALGANQDSERDPLLDIHATSDRGIRVATMAEAEQGALAAIQGDKPSFHSAHWLWKHGRCEHAAAVIRFAEQFTPETAEQLEFKQMLAAATLPKTILKDLESTEYHDYSRGLWLAQLKPDPSFVPALIAGLERQKRQRAATMEALGKTRDLRALWPFIIIMLSNDELLRPVAARALGDLGQSDAEPYLLEALGRNDDGSLQLAACEALGKVGTPRALGALSALAALPETTLEAAVMRDAASAAMKKIQERGI